MREFVPAVGTTDGKIVTSVTSSPCVFCMCCSKLAFMSLSFPYVF
jgi:hypothetical protein